MNTLENVLIDDEEIKELVKQGNYSAAAAALFESQKKSWDLLKKNSKALEKVKTKSFMLSGYEVVMQHNPKRIKSTAAKVDKKSIEARECFLCLDELPEEQKGILYNDDYLILCNPYPIFPEHFVISAVKEEPQRIKGHFEHLLDLTKDLYLRYDVFYNGPECGASAPDHLHFQAATKFMMPMDNDFQILKSFGEVIAEKTDFIFTAIDDGSRRFVALEGTDKQMLVKAFNFFHAKYAKLTGKEEPLMNIFSFYEEEYGWRVIVYLRSKHRPERYFEDDVIISPATVDLSGLLIVPQEKDFNSLSQDDVEDIFNEVSLDQELFDKLKEELK